jgi:peptidoglycan L-alanyl-D-glutamate endopeptidase CwlK
MKNKKLIARFALVFVGTLIVASLFKKKRKMQISQTWDSETDKIIGKLHPDLRPLASEFINQVEKKLGQRLKITSGLRTWDEQNKLYAKGRTNPGSIVTNARAGSSYHNYGLAFDCYLTDNGKITFKKAINKEIAQIGKNLGLEWGGNWITFKDLPHFQLTKGTISQLKSLYLSNKKDANGYLIV